MCMRRLIFFGFRFVFFSCKGLKNAVSFLKMQVEMIERTTCSCKGQCALKRGRGACLCRKEDLKCLASCKCDKSKCKNKVCSLAYMCRLSLSNFLVGVTSSMNFYRILYQRGIKEAQK